MNNSKKVSIKTINAFFLSIILVTGTIAISSSSSFMKSAAAQSYYNGIDDNKNYYKSFDKANRDKSKDSSKSVSINKLKCINTNLNINGENAGNVNIGNKGQGYLGAYSSDGGYYEEYNNNKQGKGFDDCVINNDNENRQITPSAPTTAQLTVTKNTNCDLAQDICTSIPNAKITVTGNNPNPSSFLASQTPIDVTLGLGQYRVSETGFIPSLAQCTGFEGGQQISGNIYFCTNFSDDCEGNISASQALSCTIDNTIIDTTPTTGSLTVKKEIFGCANIIDVAIFQQMDCQGLQSNSSGWLSCDNPTISNTDFCQNLQENFFDIEVLDDQDNQIQQFEGSQQGTTIQNLEPGTYTVNEIKHPIVTLNQLQEDANSESRCVDPRTGFPDGGRLETTDVSYTDLCFEYEDEQGNDCTMTSIATGEEKTCIVKNYIRIALD